MKKRILSMLLLVVMVVTALPLMALTVFATTEYDAEDYNALYVQGGLIFAADFFSTNSNWGESVRADLNNYAWTYDAEDAGAAKFSLTAIPTGAVTGGYLLLSKFSGNLSVTNSNTLTNSAQGGTTGEYVGMFSTTGSNVFALNNLRAWVSSIDTVEGQRSMCFRSLGYYAAEDQKIRTGDGKVVSFYAPSPAAVNTLTMTMDVVKFTQDYYGTYPMLRFDAEKATPEQLSASGITNSTSWQSYFYITHEGDENGVKPLGTIKKPFWPSFAPKIVTTDKVWNAETGTYEKDPGGPKNYIVGQIARDGGAGDVSPDFIKTNTYGADGEYENDNSFYTTEPGHFGVYVDGAKAFASNDVYFSNNSNNNVGGGATYLKVNQTMAATHKLYAFRQYDRVLSTDEMAQNRLADLAKFHKIDITEVKALTAFSLTTLATDPEVKALTFETDRATVEETIKTKAAHLLTLQPDEAPTFDKDDYNDLYVQQDLQVAFDFFATNANWSEAAADNLSAYVWKGSFSGKPEANSLLNGYYDMSKSTGQLSLSASNRGVGGLTGEYVGIFTSLSNTQTAFGLNNLRAGASYSASNKTVTITNIGVNNATNSRIRTSDGKKVTVTFPAPAHVTTMSMMMDIPAFTQIYYGCNPKESGWQGKNQTLDSQNNYYVTHTGDVNGVKAIPEDDVKTQYAFFDYKPTVVTTDKIWDETTQTYVTDPDGAKKYVVAATLRAGGDYTLTDLLTNTRGYGATDNYYNTTPGFFGVYSDGVPSFARDDVYYTANGYSTLTGTTFLRLWYTTNYKMYAFRQYTDVLTADEMAQNRLADLAKFHKIDLTYVVGLSDAMLLALANDPAVRALTFESDSATVSKIIGEKARALFLEQYAGEVDSDAQLVIANYGLDGRTLSRYPRGAFVETYTFLLGGYQTSDDKVADYAAALAADIVAYETGYGRMTAKEYDALYVQEDLRFAMDFFPTNSHWNPAGDGHVDYAAPLGLDEGGTLAYSDWVKEDNAFIDSFVTYREKDSLKLSPWHVNTSGKRLAFYTVGDGYIKIRTAGSAAGQPDTNGYLSFVGASAYKNYTEHSMQLTVKTGYLGTQPVSYLGVRLAGGGSPYSISKVSSGFTSTGILSPNPLRPYNAKSDSLTYTLVNTAGTDTYKIVSEDTTHYTVTGTYPASFNEWTAIGWSNSAAELQIYALRYYTADLTAEERAQNHFADLAKFFRLNVDGFEMLPEEMKQELYAIARSYDFTSARDTVAQAIVPRVSKGVQAAYEPLKGEDEKQNAFLDLAADYALDVSEVLADRGNMSHVYKTMTADALTAKGFALAQQLLDETYFDAHHFLVHAKETGDSADWDDLLVSLALAYDVGDEIPNLDGLMSLPQSKRGGVLEGMPGTEDLAALQAHIDAYVAEEMKAYTGYRGLAADDYNALYLKDGLLWAMDFFDTNTAWGGEAVTMTKADEVVEAITSRVWYDTTVNSANPIKPTVTMGPTSLTIQGGGFATYGDNINNAAKDGHVIEIRNVGAHTDYGKGTGATMDMVAILGASQAIIFNNMRPTFTTHNQKGENNVNATGAWRLWLTDIAPQNTTLAPIGLGYSLFAKSCYTTATSVAMVMKLPELTENAPWGSTTVAYRVGTYMKDANGDYLLDEEGEPIISVGSEVKNQRPFHFPAGLRKVTTSYVDGVQQLDPETQEPIYTTYENVYIKEDHMTYGGEFSLYENGETLYSKTGDDMPWLNNASAYNDSTYWKHAASTRLSVYANRFYNRALTAAEVQQNHFADIAKWHRIDLTCVKLLNEASLTELYTYAAGLGVTDAASKASVEAKAQALFEAQSGKTLEEYREERIAALTPEVGEDFATLAAENNLNLDRLVSIKEAESIKVITDAILADFPVGYAANEYVLRDALNAALAFLDSIDFVGAQVRIDSYYDVERYPGIRAIFRIGEDQLTALLEAEKSVEIGARVFGVYPDGKRTDPITLRFTPKLVEGNLVFDEDSKSGWMQDPEDPSREMLGFAYTVTYKNWQSNEFDGATSYNRELDYEFYVTLDGVTYTREVNFGQFGDSVSAADIYRYFYNMEGSEFDYKNDAVVKSVIDVVGAEAPQS